MNEESVEIQSWRLDDLHPHPEQRKFFGAPDESDVGELTADMKLRGQKNPITISPDGTIVCGHNRVEAARRLEWPTIKVIVRPDLADDRNLQIEELLKDNLARRNIRPLQIARAYRELNELCRRPGNASRFRYEENYLQRAAERLGVKSIRSARRYFNILEAPQVVQDAFERGELTVNMASRVAACSSERQAQMVAEIAAGAQAKTVVKKYVGRRPATKKQRQTKPSLFDALSVLMDLDVNALSPDVADETLDDLCVLLTTRANELLNWNSEVLKSRKSAKLSHTADCRPQPGARE